MHIKHLAITSITWFALLMPWSVEADQVKEVDGYEIYYSIFNTSFLTPEIAAAYDIVRAKNRALVNIAVRKKKEGGGDKAVKAIVSGTVKDLIYRRPLEFFEVREEGSVYYLSELRFNHKEKLFFDINVQPDPNKRGYTVKFDKTLYVDD